jgi:hypothetical protein
MTTTWLTKELNVVLADVIGNRDINEITEQDFLAVGARHSEGYPHGSPPGRWLNEAYDARSALMGYPVPEKGPVAVTR